ncbi:MAG: hypothetical protein WCJ25_04820 [Candidatus Moraniibacteriota bacterium]
MSNYKEGQIHMVSDALEQKGEFTPDDMTLLGQATPEQLKSVRGYLRGTHGIIKRDYRGFTETALLSPDTTFFASGKGELDEDAFFQSREGEIWVSPSFRKRFGRTFRKSQASNRRYVACELKQNASDTDIRANLPVSHLSKLGDIARFIKAQRGGKKGVLLNNGLANIFYVEDENGQVFAVLVGWGSGGRTWYVYDWRLDEDGDWLAGRQVLCPGNAVL